MGTPYDSRYGRRVTRPKSPTPKKKQYAGPVAVPPGRPGVAGYNATPAGASAAYRSVIQNAQNASGARFGREYDAMQRSVQEPYQDATFYVDSASGGGGRGGGGGGGGRGGPSPAALAQFYASLEAEANRSAGAQTDFLGQQVAGASGRIQESGDALMQALAGLRTSSQADAARTSQSIAATRTGLQSSSADQLARLQRDLTTQGVNTSPLLQQAQLQQRDLADASGRSSGLAALLAQIQGEDINNREATGRAVTTGSQNNLSFEEMLRRFAIEQQRQQELAQIAQQRLQSTLGI